MPRSPTAKSLLILRHAHAEAGSADGSDFSRRLSEDGRKEAKRVGKFLRHQELGIDGILCSAAVRTVETAEGVLEGAKLSAALVTERAIYECSAEDLLRTVRKTADTIHQLLLVGHNPGVADLLALLASRASALSVHYPPATLSLVQFDGDWRALGPSRAMLRWLVPVKLMGA
jgi:phosphohistidine phosphatase